MERNTSQRYLMTELCMTEPSTVFLDMSDYSGVCPHLQELSDLLISPFGKDHTVIVM